MRILAWGLLALVIAAGLFVGVLTLWSSVEDSRQRHHGPLPDVALPASQPARPEPLPPVLFAVPDDANRVHAASGLASALFGRAMEPAVRKVSGRAEPPPGKRAALWVAAFGPTLLAGPTEVEPDGRFVLVQVPDALCVLVFGEDPMTLRSGYRRRLNLEARGDIDLDVVEVPSHALEVRVLDAQAAPVSGAVVWITSRDDPEWRPRASSLGSATRPAQVGSDALGSVRLDQLPAGRFELHIVAPPRYEPISKEVSVPSREAVLVTVPGR